MGCTSSRVERSHATFEPLRKPSVELQSANEGEYKRIVIVSSNETFVEFFSKIVNQMAKGKSVPCANLQINDTSVSFLSFFT